MKKHAKHLNCNADNSREIYYDTFYIMKNGKPLFFGSASIRKNYVSFYLMPVYVNPQLLEGASAELKKRMQGKSCFNFKEVNPKLLKELTMLTQKGFEYYEESGYI